MKPQVRHLRNLILLLILAAGTIYILWNHNRPATWHTTQGYIYGTTYHITYQSPQNLDKTIVEALQSVDRSLSAFNPQSTLSRINRNETQETDTLFRRLFYTAQHVSQTTRGAFDITVGPLVNAWGFGFKNKENVTQALIDSLLRLTGYTKIHINGKKQLVKEHPNIQLDCSAIAKGLGCDLVAEEMQKHKIRNFLIEIGGEIRASGNNKEGHTWTIGVVKPEEQADSTLANPIQTVLSLTNTALATSGNYRNFYIEGDKKYAHTINPHTGQPIQHSLLSATIIAPTCIEADAYATASMVMGLQSAVEILKSEPGILWYFIYQDEDGQEKAMYSPELEPHIVRQ